MAQATEQPRPGRLQRVPPNDPRLEANLLGAALLDRRAAELVAATPPEAFYKPAHSHIAHCLAELVAAGRPTDAGTTASHLNQLGLLDACGGYPAIIDLTAEVPTTGITSTGDWAQQIQVLANRRHQLALASEIIESVYRGVPTTGLASQLEQAADQLEQLHTSTWEPVNLAATLAGDNPVTVPTILERTDQCGLIYPGKVHVINAEPEAGKSWVALLACLQQIRLFQHTLYIDLEDSAAEIVSRLLQMGAAPDEILTYFHYVRPDDPLDPTATAKVAAIVDTFQPALAVIDGVTEAIVGMGGSIKDNDDIARFLAALPRPIAKRGPAVLLLDHVVKNKDERGRWGIGGQHKLAGTDGATYTLEKITAFAPGVPGSSRLTVSKDRPGQVRSNTKKQGAQDVAGTVKYESHPGGAIDIIIHPVTGDENPTWTGPTHCRDAIVELLSGMPDEPLSRNQIADRLRARGQSYRNDIISSAAEMAVDQQLLTGRPGPRSSRLYTYERPQDDLGV